MDGNGELKFMWKLKKKSGGGGGVGLGRRVILGGWCKGGCDGELKFL